MPAHRPDSNSANLQSTSRAERKLGLMLKAQKDAGRMNAGTKGQLSGSDSSGSRTVKPPENTAPTLADMGVSKSMSSRAQAIADVPEHKNPLTDGQPGAS